MLTHVSSMPSASTPQEVTNASVTLGFDVKMTDYARVRSVTYLWRVE